MNNDKLEAECKHDIDIDTSMTRLRCVKCGLDANVIEIQKLTLQIEKAEEVISFYSDRDGWREQVCKFHSNWQAIGYMSKTGGNMAQDYFKNKEVKNEY